MYVCIFFFIFLEILVLMFRLPECTTGSMVRKVLEFTGFSKLGMRLDLTGLLSRCLILLEGPSLMKASG